ncbi:MAG: ribosome biogenesis GTPase [Candidatus Poriferisodalaceae bacterium]|jgi:ribosome biogenesis GTPase
MIDGGVSLDRLGWSDEFAAQVRDLSPELRIGRVAVEHRGAYEILGPDGMVKAAVSAELRRAATSPVMFPAVGDWVVHSSELGHDRRLVIERILDRSSQLLRRAPGPDVVPQVVGANIDEVAIVTTTTEDLNERRLERYLALAHGGSATPVVVVNKIDLASEEEAVRRVRDRFGRLEVLTVSAVRGDGLEQVRGRLSGNRTLAFTGSSGVGKSTLVNALLGNADQAIGDVRDDGRGRHTTIRRHLLLAPGEGVVVDTPGLREIQLWDGLGLDETFPELSRLARGCRFADCAHQREPGCAVRKAAADGTVPADRVDALVGLINELADLAIEIEERERTLRRREDARSKKRRRR